MSQPYPQQSATDPAQQPQIEQQPKTRQRIDDGQIPDADMARAAELIERVTAIFRQRVVGQESLHRALLSGLIANGHVLLESVPGLAKTTAAQALATAVGGSFHRIQCTPDLMPNDIIGTQIFNFQTGEMTTQIGPVHANFVLLDEINRSSAKTQSAMLEAMQERQTTIGGKVYELPKPFMVMATQNPIEEEGTYVLPEAQMDRFLLKEVITYPTPEEEMKILDMSTSGVFDAPTTGAPITTEDVLFLQATRRRIFVHDAIRAYIVDIINTTRGYGPHPIPGLMQQLRVGASPRGSLALLQVAQTQALIAGRNYVIPDDIVSMRYPVLRHRLIRSYEAIANELSVNQVIDSIFGAVPVP